MCHCLSRGEEKKDVVYRCFVIANCKYRWRLYETTQPLYLYISDMQSHNQLSLNYFFLFLSSPKPKARYDSAQMPLLVFIERVESSESNN